MHFLKTIGLDNMVEPEEHFMNLVGYTAENGKIFNGYRGFYAYDNFGYAEMLDHVAPNAETGENEIIGFSSHCMGNNNWRLEIADKGVLEEDTDVMSKCVFFTDPEISDAVFPIRLVMSDVLPCYLPGEKVTMQIQAFPDKIDYYPNEEVFLEARSTKYMGSYLHFGDGHIMNFGLDDSCFMMATVKNVRKLFASDYEAEKREFMYVTVHTEYGDVAFCHALEMVPEEQREYIKEGAVLFSTFVLCGDVAIGEYQQGAVYDEEHDLKLLQDALANYTFARCHKAFAANAKFLGMDGTVKCEDGAGCLARLEEQAKGMVNKRTVYAYPATIVGYHDETIVNPYAVGKHVLLISYDTPAFFTQLIAIEVDEEGKIAKFVLQECAPYKIHIDMPNEWQRNETTALNVLKESIDSTNVSKMINLLNDNAWFIMKQTLKCRNAYDVLYYLQEIIRVFNPENAHVDNYLVKIKDYNDKNVIPKYLPGKLAIAFTLKDLVHYEALMFIQLDDQGEISGIELLEDNGYIVEEVEPDQEICETYAEEQRFTPVNINRTADEWLDVLANWFNGKDDEDYKFLFYNGMAPEVVCTVNEDEISTEYKGKEAVYGEMQVLTNLGYSNADIITDEDGKKAMQCDGLFIKMETNEEGRILKIDMNVIRN